MPTFNIDQINQEYLRLARLVLAGHYSEAEAPALELRHALTREAGLSYTKKRVENLLADIARNTSNGNGRIGGYPRRIEEETP